MARNAGLGSTAAQVISIGDLDVLKSRKGHQEILDGIEQVETAQADRRLNEYVGEIDARIDRLKKHLDRRARRRERKNADLEDQVRLNKAWRDAGIRSRFVVINSPVLRIVAWVMFAAVDFYLFAVAMTIALREDTYDPNGLLGFSWGFWIGGVMGLMVFALGLVLGHLIRQADYVRAQKQLLNELKSRGVERPELVSSGNSTIVFIVVGAVFIIFIIASLFVRAEGADISIISADAWSREANMLGSLFMQTLVPFVAVCVEVVMHDPTHVPIKQPNWIDFYIERKMRRNEVVKRKRELKVQGYKDAIQARYRTERAVLKTFHDSQGFSEA